LRARPPHPYFFRFARPVRNPLYQGFTDLDIGHLGSHPGAFRAQFHTPVRCQCRVQFHTPGHSDEAACELGAGCFTSGGLLCAASCLACFTHCWPTCGEESVELCTLAGQASHPRFLRFAAPSRNPLYRPFTELDIGHLGSQGLSGPFPQGCGRFAISSLGSAAPDNLRSTSALEAHPFSLPTS
jgi:hypothetical protein